MSERYLVTGCAGFIAARVVERLLEAGHRVLGVDNLNDAYDPRLKRWRLARLTSHTHFAFHPGDVSCGADWASLEALSREEPLAAMLHLAARSGVRASALYPQLYVETNVTGTENAVEFCLRQGVRKFVLSSSSSVYGASSATPFHEESDTSHPASPYAASKKAAEELAKGAADRGLDVSVLRYFTVYGPAGRPDMSVLKFLRAIDAGQEVVVLGDGSQSRDFTYVDDIAAGTLAALRPVGYRAFNLGGDSPSTVHELIELAAQAVGKPAKIVHQPAHPADVPATWASIDRARKELGWAPQVPLAEGLRRTYAWYRAERSWLAEMDW